MKILILGVSGMLGHQLARELARAAEVVGTIRQEAAPLELGKYTSGVRVITKVEVHDTEALQKLLFGLRPNVVVNSIGIIKQLKEALDPALSIYVNALFPHILSGLCKEISARLIQISTDCVFSGRGGMYNEDDNPDPVDLYGRTKLLGEVYAGNAITIRSSIIGRELRTRHSLLEWFLAQKSQEIEGYAKAIYSGLTTLEMARVINRLIFDFQNLSGMWHIASQPISKYDLLCALKDAFEMNVSINRATDFVCDRSLNAERFLRATGYVAPSWGSMICELAHEHV